MANHAFEALLVIGPALGEDLIGVIHVATAVGAALALGGLDGVGFGGVGHVGGQDPIAIAVYKCKWKMKWATLKKVITFFFHLTFTYAHSEKVRPKRASAKKKKVNSM